MRLDDKTMIHFFASARMIIFNGNQPRETLSQVDIDLDRGQKCAR